MTAEPPQSFHVQSYLCCLRCIGNGDHKVVAVDDNQTSDNGTIEFRTKCRLRVNHFLALHPSNDIRDQTKHIPKSTIMPDLKDSPSSWVNQGIHPGKIWLYYDRPLNYSDRLFKKFTSSKVLEIFSMKLSSEILSSVLKKAKSNPTSGKHSNAPNFHPKNALSSEKQPNKSKCINDKFKNLNPKKPMEQIKEDVIEVIEPCNIPGACHSDSHEMEKGSIRPSFNPRKSRHPIIFFIHDIGYSSDVWQHQTHSFSCSGYEVVVMDLLGHGFSFVPTDPEMYTMKEITKDILVVIDSYCQEKQPCILVGQGYGCELALNIAYLRPEQVTLMVFVGFGYKFKDDEPVRRISNVTKLSNVICKYFSTKLSSIKRQMYSTPKFVIQYMGEGRQKELDMWYYRGIRTPTLLVHGIKDSDVDIKEAAELESLLPRSYLELIPNAGHLCMLESPDTFNNLLLHFLRSWKQSCQ